MSQWIPQFLRAQHQRLDRSEDGAILLLVLAALVILLLVSMTMFDAGKASQEEIQTQNAADSAAYSQSVVKARSMNMLTYANSTKRMLFSYFVTHSTAMTALIASEVIYCARCVASYGSDTYACSRCVVGGIQLGVESANIASNVMSTAERTADELQTLDDFQAYLVGITPWWGYAENLMRGRFNGATATTAWPPPEATLPSWANDVVNAVESFDDTFDTDLGSNLPGTTDKFDSLPVTKRDASGGSSIAELTDYCAEFTWSLEHVIPALEHVLESDGGGQDSKGISTDAQTLAIFMGLNIVPEGNCISTLFATLPTYSGDSDVAENVMDYRVDEGGLFPSEKDENQWLQETSNITLAYRMSDRDRSRSDNVFERVGTDHTENPIFQSSGTWSMARSEIVFSETWLNSNLPGGLSSFGQIASNAMAGRMVALRGGPHMWTPRWTARLRPVYLPGEDLGETIQGDPVGIGPIFVDSLPYLAASSQLSAVIDGNFDIGTAIEDMYFMYVSSGSIEADHLEGITQ